MKKYSFPLLIIVVFSIFFLYFPTMFAGSQVLQKLTLGTRDVFFNLRHLSTSIPETIEEIVIVTIDEESCQKLQARWPWSRVVFSQLIDKLGQNGAKTIGLNVAFTGLEDGKEETSLEMAKAMTKQGNVVVGVSFDQNRNLIKPTPIIERAAARLGYLEKIVDPDFSIRRAYLLWPYAIRLASGAIETPTLSTSSTLFERSFPLQMVAQSLNARGKDELRFDEDLGLLTVGSPPKMVFIESDGSYTINYLAHEADFHRISAWKILQGKVSPSELQGKAVFIGLTSSLFSDMHPTPYGIMSGIAIHANEYLSIMSGRILQFVPDKITFSLSWLASLTVLLLFLFKRFWFGMLAAVLVFFAALLGAQTAFAKDFVLEPFYLVFGPLMATLTGILANSLKLLLENKGLETKAIHDKMTGLYTYDFLRIRLDEEWKRCQRSKIPVTIAMTDLDRFKKINDTLGHEVGNIMIKRAAGVIRESVRGYDIVSRYGGDEFVILLWHSNFEEGKSYRDRLRNLYHTMAKKLEPALQDSSISIGIATFDPNVNPNFPTTPQELVEEADKDLYLDKESRRQARG